VLILRHAIQRLRRGWRSGELLVLSLALGVACAASVSVGLFSDRVRQAMENGSGDTLGADALVESHRPLPEDTLAALRALGLRTTTVTEFSSVVTTPGGEQTQLAGVRAVEPGYPLRGVLSLSGEPYGAARPAQGIPPPGQAWIDVRLWNALSLSAGATLLVGELSLKVTSVIADEPGRGGAIAEFAPELLLNAADLPASKLVGPGSRVQYTEQLAGPPPAVERAAAMALPPGARLHTPRDARPEIRQPLERAGNFLDIAVLATLLLAAASVALSARLHSLRLRDEAALLKCLGASRRFIARALGLQLLLLGLAAGGAGAVIGLGGQALLAHYAAPLLGQALPAPHWLPLPLALLLVLLMLAGFALPPVLQAAGASPIQVFQRAPGSPALGRAGLLAAVAAIAALIGLQAGDFVLAAWVAGGALLAAGLLAGLAWALVLALSPLRRRSGVAWRFGLGNIARRRGAAVGQAVALGVALLALLLVTVVRSDLLEAWRGRLPADAPNQFLINIQPEQIEPLKKFFAARGYPSLNLWPMARARLVGLNGKPVTADSFSDERTRHWVNREFNMSWSDSFGDDNKLETGQWWTAADRGKPWLSAEDYAVERLKLKLGDTMTLDIAGKHYTLTVHNTRSTRWDSFRPNFFLVTPPGVLDDSGAVQWITSFHLPSDQRGLLRELVRQFPNITALDLDAGLKQVRGIIDRLVQALEFIFGFTLAAGLVVMLAVIEASRAERARETALLRALGASSRTILQGLLAEYAALGLLAGSVAAIAAQAIAWALAVFVLEVPYGPRPLLWLAGALGGCGLVTLVGWISLRPVLRTPPRQVLAG
jgi:putative ABC transport system permease protein